MLDQCQPNHTDFIQKTPAKAALSYAFVLALLVDWQLGWKNKENPFDCKYNLQCVSTGWG